MSATKPSRGQPSGSTSQRRRGGVVTRVGLVPPSDGVPPLPDDREWTDRAETWWATVWQSAVSSGWTADDQLLAERGLTLIDDYAQLDNGDLSGPQVRLRLAVSHELRQVESALGLSPRARSQLKIEIARSDEVESRRAARQRRVESEDELAARRDELVAKLERTKNA